MSRPLNLITLTTAVLRERFAAATGSPTQSANRAWLAKRIRAAEAKAAPRLAPASRRRGRAAQAVPAVSGDTVRAPRRGQQATAVAMPPPGGEIRKTWRGRELVVTVLADGFRLNGTVYRSLSAAATALCGGNRNGLLFFGLKPRPPVAAAARSHAPGAAPVTSAEAE